MLYQQNIRIWTLPKCVGILRPCSRSTTPFIACMVDVNELISWYTITTASNHQHQQTEMRRISWHRPTAAMFSVSMDVETQAHTLTHTNNRASVIAPSAKFVNHIHTRSVGRSLISFTILLTPASTRYLLSCVTGVSAFWQLIIAHHQSTIQFTGAHHQYTDIRHDKDNTHTHTSAAVPRVSIGNNIIIIGQHCTRLLSVPFPILSLAQLRVSIRVCWACALDRSVFTSVSSSSTFLIKPSTLRIVRD